MPPTASSHTRLLHLVQALPTSGARAVQPFEIDGHTYLAVPQLAEDIADQPPYMNGGDSDIGMPIYRWDDGRFIEVQRLPVSGGEDAEFFRIGERAFLATASLRTGAGPYALDADSTIYEWRNGAFVAFQRQAGFAAKQWRHFQVGARHFLGFAQGVVLDGVTPRNPSQSVILEWKGDAFEPFQTVPSAWGYNWTRFSVDGHDFLAYADHIAPSIILRWDGAQFVPFQTIEDSGGRAFCCFAADDDTYLAFAKLQGNSLLYRWDGERFALHQTLSGPGGREFAYLQHGAQHYLIQANFITGSPKEPATIQQSVVYRLERGAMVVADRFTTAGATSVATFTIGADTFVAVAESLSAAIRFRTDSHIYRFATASTTHPKGT